MPTRLLVLGAGRHQVGLIERAEERGIEVVVSDYLPDSPGKALASQPTMTDALDVEANVELARSMDVAGVITSGTDQAVVTMAEVAARLGLPCTVNPDAARLATDKRAMKDAYARCGLPHARYVEVASAAAAGDATASLSYPLVVKPADSQGQRGTSRIDDAAQLEAAVERALGQSRAGVALVEEFIDGLELTVNAWAEDGEPRLLMVADRVTFNPLPAIGICFQHRTPSVRARGHLERMRELTRGVMAAYGVDSGPLYIQMLARGDDVYVVEGACRVGGGHEASMIPRVTGEDVTGRLIDLALTGRAAPIESEADDDGPPAVVTFLLARAGTVAARGGLQSVLDDGLAAEAQWYRSVGDRCSGMIDGQGRAGYLLATAGDRGELDRRIRAAYDRLSLEDAAGDNLLFWPDAGLLR